MKIKEGFTLAEVLITLGIIGIVAAMTLPTLISNYQKVVLETAYKKGLSVVANAVQMAMAQNETPGDFASTPIVGCYNNETANNPLPLCLYENSKKMYTVTLDDSRTQELYNTMSEIYYNMNIGDDPKLVDIFLPPAYAGLVINPYSPEWEGVVYTFMTPDGIVFGYLNEFNGAIYSDPNNYNSSTIAGFYMLMDVNGAKKPNKLGEDLFYLGINKRGKVLNMSCALNRTCSDEDYLRLYDMAQLPDN